MSTPKFTPGPWHIQGKSGDNYDGLYVYDETYRQVGTAMGEANAALIAAAPDLYQAALSAVAALTQAKTYPADISLAVNNLKWALARTEGHHE
jgi:hypothetical protein